MDLSIILVNWNSLNYIRECLESVYAQTHGLSFEVIVVDNASPEGGVDSLKSQFPSVQIIKSEQNLGFGRANNLGFQHAQGDLVLLLNPDTLLKGPAINVLVDSFRQLPDAGILGGKLLNTDLTVQTQAIQTFPRILNQLLNIESLRLRWPGCPLWNIAPLFKRNGRPVKVEVIPGACMLMRSEAFRKAGMFSEEFFMYGEDLDLNWKIKSLGLSNYYIEDAEIIHHGGTSSSQQKASEWSTIMIQKAMMQYYRKNHSEGYSLLYRFAIGSSAALRLLLLGVMVPFAGKDNLRPASSRWSTVLKWALGRSELQLSNSRQ